MELKEIIVNKEKRNLIFREVKLFNRKQKMVLVLNKESGEVNYYIKDNNSNIFFNSNTGFVVNTCENCGDIFVTNSKPKKNLCQECLLLDKATNLATDVSDILNKIFKNSDDKKEKATATVIDDDVTDNNDEGDTLDDNNDNTARPSKKRRCNKQNIAINNYLKTLDEVYDVADREERKKYYTLKSPLVSDDTLIAIINMLYRNEDLKTIADKFKLKLESATRYCYMLGKMGIAYRYIDRDGKTQYKLYDNLNIVKVR